MVSLFLFAILLMSLDLETNTRISTLLTRSCAVFVP